MLVVKQKRYKKQHVIGGSGIFDTVINFAKKLVSSGAAKSAASALASSAAKQAGKHLADKVLLPATPPTSDVQQQQQQQHYTPTRYL